MSLDPVGVQAVRVALALGLFEGRADLPERGVRPLRLVLESAGVWQDAQRFLREEWPALRDTPVPPKWERLEETVRTGQCQCPPIEGEEDAGEFFAAGVVEVLFSLHWGAACHLASFAPEGAERVLDLGAGSAVWSLGLVTQRPGVRAVALDRERVLREVTGPMVERHKVADRYELRPGSYRTTPYGEGYDVVYLGHVVHSEGWDTSRQLLQSCRQALRPGGQLAIAEMVGSEPRSLDYTANLFDLNMLMFTEQGCVFSARELETMALEGGFCDPQWVRGPGQYPVLLATRP